MGDRLLLIGVGNRDRGDDAVGPVVCDLVREARLPGIELVVFEGAMVDLALHWEPSDHVWIVDAAAPAGHPGRTNRIDALASTFDMPGAVSTHSIDVSAAVELARVLERMPASLTLVGIEGASFEHGAPLTPAVTHAAGRVVARVRRHTRSSTSPKLAREHRRS